jgi:hypothetical protein
MTRAILIGASRMSLQKFGDGKNGAPGEIRTPDPLLRRQMLYPAELRARSFTLPNSALKTPVFEAMEKRHRLLFRNTFPG